MRRAAARTNEVAVERDLAGKRIFTLALRLPHILNAAYAGRAGESFGAAAFQPQVTSNPGPREQGRLESRLSGKGGLAGGDLWGKRRAR